MINHESHEMGRMLPLYNQVYNENKNVELIIINLCNTRFVIKNTKMDRMKFGT